MTASTIQNYAQDAIGKEKFQERIPKVRPDDNPRLIFPIVPKCEHSTKFSRPLVLFIGLHALLDHIRFFVLASSARFALLHLLRALCVRSLQVCLLHVLHLNLERLVVLYCNLLLRVKCPDSILVKVIGLVEELTARELGCGSLLLL